MLLKYGQVSTYRVNDLQSEEAWSLKNRQGNQNTSMWISDCRGIKQADVLSEVRFSQRDWFEYCIHFEALLTGPGQFLLMKPEMMPSTAQLHLGLGSNEYRISSHHETILEIIIGNAG